MASLSAELLEIQGEQCLLTVIQDVTERKLAEKALKESEKNYRLLADNVEDVIFFGYGSELFLCQPFGKDPEGI